MIQMEIKTKIKFLDKKRVLLIHPNENVLTIASNRFEAVHKAVELEKKHQIPHPEDNPISDSDEKKKYGLYPGHPWHEEMEGVIKSGN